ncbi:MAG: flagellar protein FlgN [candidate division Zixibacteria bacterium]|nr:flagellar protein FlgN [candidate division Zixibacteria bacterium]
MIDQLIQVISDEALLFEEFLQLLDCQREALVANDTDRLNQVTQLQQQKLLECRALDRRREKVIAAIKADNAIEGDVTVTRLIEYADENQSHRLTLLRDTILSLNERISETRNTNALLLNRSREYISRIMNMLARVHTPDGTYGRHGVAQQESAALAVDRRI